MILIKLVINLINNRNKRKRQNLYTKSGKRIEEKCVLPSVLSFAVFCRFKKHGYPKTGP